MKRKHREKPAKEYTPGKYSYKQKYIYTGEIPDRETIRRQGDRIARGF